MGGQLRSRVSTQEKPEREQSREEGGGRMPVHRTTHAPVPCQCLPFTRYIRQLWDPGDQARDHSAFQRHQCLGHRAEQRQAGKNLDAKREESAHFSLFTTCLSLNPTLYSEGHLRAARPMDDGRPELTTPRTSFPSRSKSLNYTQLL